LRLPVRGQVPEVGFGGAAVLLACAVEPLVLGAIQAEPLLPGTIRMTMRPIALVGDQSAGLLADAMPPIDPAMRAIGPAVTVPARAPSHPCQTRRIGIPVDSYKCNERIAKSLPIALLLLLGLLYPYLEVGLLPVNGIFV